MQNHNILINPSDIALSDRSVQYGDASFTTMYCENRTIVLFDSHMTRLKSDCSMLDIQFEDWLFLQETLRKLTHEQILPSVIKVLITRGSGGRGYQAPTQQQPRCIISTHSAETMRELATIDCLKLSSITLPSHSGLDGVKHTNRLAQVMAKTEAKALGCDEVLMCDENQHVIEASSANVFYCLDGAWHTPSLDGHGVKGVMREAFIEYLYSQGMHVNFATHHVSQFLRVKHVLLSNAVKGVRAVHYLDLDVDTTSDKKNSSQSKISLSTNIDNTIKPFIQNLLSSSKVQSDRVKAL